MAKRATSNRNRTAKAGARTASYKHPEATSLLRPEVGTQSQFKKKKPPATYRYDSSLSPALEWDGQNAGARDAAEEQLRVSSFEFQAAQQQLVSAEQELLTIAAALESAGRKEEAARLREILARNLKLATGNLSTASQALERLQRLSRPFLNWAGKAERLSFDVPTLPLFVHERLSTKAILETLKGHRRSKKTQLDLFNDPQHPVADQVLKAYEFPDKWQNRLILGDSLVVMNSLLRYEGLGGQVQMIYMDPPYGIEYGSNFQPFVRKRDVKHNDDQDMTREPEMVKAYRDTWELGLHSYLTYLRDRLLVARDLLHPSGSIFVQINDERLHVVRAALEEVFGAENFIVTFLVKKKGSQKGQLVDPINDYVLWCARDIDAARRRFQKLYERMELDADAARTFRYVELPDGREITLVDLSKESPSGVNYALRPDLVVVDFPGARLFTAENLTSGGFRRTQSVKYKYKGRVFDPGIEKGNCWKHSAITDDGSPSGLDKLATAGRLFAGEGQLRFKRYLGDFGYRAISNWWDRLGGAADPIYVVQTNIEIVKRCMLMTTIPGDLVFDPTCGSGTTAFAAEQWGRRWITCDASRVPLSLARQRLLTATFDYYELRDEARGPVGGFVYKPRQNTRGEEVGGIVPHVTSSTIANDEPGKEEVLVDRPEIVSKTTRITGPFVVEATIPTPIDWDSDGQTDTGAAASQDYGTFVDRMIEVLRRSPVLHVGGNKTVSLKNIRPPAKTLSLSAEALCEFQVSSVEFRGKANGGRVSGSAGVAEGSGPGDAGVRGHGEFSSRRNVRTDEPDAESGGISAQQHRGGSGKADKGGVSAVPGARPGEPAGAGNAGRDRGKVGIPQATAGAHPAGSIGGGQANAERPDRVDPKLETGNLKLETRPVAILFGPENGAVSEKAVYEAAREAHAKSYAHLYVIGFAIQPNARKLIDDCEQAVGVPATYVQATPDLMMGDLLKNMRSSQIFSVCGLPEVRLRKADADELKKMGLDPKEAARNGWYQAELLGLDVFDPATMEVDHRPGSDVPCWMLDSDYNGLCFKASQVFFPRTAAWDDLKRALKAEYAESVWDHLAGTTSAPFQIGENGQVAVKVIDDRGNELLVVKKASEADR